MPTFSRQDVIDAIFKGDDTKMNYLFVDLGGCVHLVPESSHLNPDRDNQDVAGYLPSFCPCNGQVGQFAARDEKHVNDCYHGLLTAWHGFLKSGVSRQLIDHVNDSINRLEAEVLELERKNGL